MQVPFFDYKHIFNQYKKELSEIIINISEKGSFILQNELKDFEKNFASYLNADYSVGVGNCTDGLLLALKAAGVGNGDEVIFCSHTFVATASAIHYSGADPVPVECGSDHLIDTKMVQSAITSRTKAVIPTQLNGQICDMDSIGAICKKNNLLLIEDAAQSLGATFKGKTAGTFGIASSFSFYPAKNLGCFGDGGSVATNDEKFFENLSLLRDHGRSHNGEVVQWGMNSRLDNLHAAILDFKLTKYPDEIKRRREIAMMYDEGLNAVSELKLPTPPSADPDKYEVFQNYEIEVISEEDREPLRSHLNKKGVGTILQWGGKAVHEFERLGLKAHLPFTESLMRRAFLLPMNPSLQNNQVELVVESINNFFGYGK